MGEGFAELTAFRSCRPGVAGGIVAASTVPNEVFGSGWMCRGGRSRPNWRLPLPCEAPLIMQGRKLLARSSARSGRRRCGKHTQLPPRPRAVHNGIESRLIQRFITGFRYAATIRHCVPFIVSVG